MKIHLKTTASGAFFNLCGQRNIDPERMTTDEEEITCRRCIKYYSDDVEGYREMRNQVWAQEKYDAAVEKRLREGTATPDAIERFRLWTKQVSDQVLSKQTQPMSEEDQDKITAVAKLADDFTRNEVLSSNVFRVHLGLPRVERCENCGNEIKVAIFRGGSYCSDDCRKALGDDIV